MPCSKFNRLNSLISRIVINIFVFLFGIILVELIFGDWISPNRLNRLNIVKDSIFYHDISGLYPSNKKIIKYTRDKFGFRGDYPDVKDIDILTIGGSTADQRYITDGKTWQDRLQKEFDKNGKKVYVVNAAIDGQSTYGHIKNFEWWFPHVPNLRVKYFLFYVGLNDFFIDDKDKYDDLLGEHHIIVKIKIAIKNQSAMYYLYRTFNGMVKAYIEEIGHGASQNFSTKNWVNKGLIGNYDFLMNNKLVQYGNRINILCKKVKALGAKCIFVTQKNRAYYLNNGVVFGSNSIHEYNGKRYNGVDFHHMMTLINSKTLEICSKNGGIGIDLASELDLDLVTDFYDENHNTPIGAEKIGKYLYEKLSYLFNHESNH